MDRRAREAANAAQFDDWAATGRGVRMAAGHAELVTWAYDHWQIGPGARVLDLGCGVGEALAEAGRRGAAELAGIDVAPAMIAEGRRRVPTADLRVGSAQALPWPDGRFTHVISVESLYYHDDPVGSLAEAARVTAPGGRVGTAIELYADNPGAHGWIEAMDVPVHVWDTPAWVRAFERAGLREVSAARIVRAGSVPDDFAPSVYFPSRDAYATYLREGALWVEAHR